jgi:SAM-dependent methyltransferase
VHNGLDTNRNRAHRDERYRTNFTPWDVGVPDQHLIELVEGGRVAPGRALEVGCGTGTNARWLAERGFAVVAVDLSSLAVERVERGPRPERGSLEVHCLDFLTEPVPGGPFDLVFDRGCFHVFDAASERARFAERVAELLAPEGRWLSLIGSTEGPAREEGPPRRSALDIVTAVEPSLAVEELRATGFRVERMATPAAWSFVARRRSVPAQPSTRRT